MGWLESKNLLECVSAVGEIKSDDWRVACHEWIQRREDKLK